jgi:arsenical-resistance protein 2
VIPGAINLPAQTFYQLLPTLTSLLATIPIVIFYCCSSVGRAACCAGWFEDALPPDSTCKVFTLEGGIKAWRARTGENKQVVVVMPLEEARGTGTGTGK